MNYPVERSTMTFPSGDSHCTAWLFTPRRVSRPPVVVLGHGMGCTREMRLGAFAERFCARGMACIAFTYRNFGDSGGRNRQELDVAAQLDDWEAALAHARTLPDVDGDRIAIWGSSFGGGHAITIASRHPELSAAVSQCPFTDGVATALRQKPRDGVRLQALVARDAWSRVAGRPPVTVPFAPTPGGLALMATHDAFTGYMSLVPEGGTFVNSAPARAIPRIARYRPGRRAKRVQAPMLFCISDNDSVAPADVATKYARQAPRGVVKSYDDGHFAFHTGSAFERLVGDQTAFFAEHLRIERQVG